MTDTWAAKVLEGVGRIWAYSYEVNEADNGAEPEDWKTFQTWDVADPYPILGKEYVAVDDALAAIARMGAGDDMVERLLENDREIFLPLLGEAAAHIAALTAQNREMALDVLASSGQAADAYAAQLAAEAERDALRERVARLEGAGDFARLIGNDDGKDDKDTVLVSYGMLRRLRAALTDGGSDE